MTSDRLWKHPLRWALEPKANGPRVMVFGNSLDDLCEDPPTIDEIRPRIWKLVEQTRDVLIWQFLTATCPRPSD